jgi:hypothetical protein
LYQEREELDRLRQLVEEDKKRDYDKKQQLANENMMEYYNHMMNKQKEQENSNYDKIHNKQPVSLEMNHEKRLEDMKDYFTKLNDKVDTNMSKYNDYLHQVSPKAGGTLDRNYHGGSPTYHSTLNLGGNNNVYFHPESKPIKSDVTSNHPFDRAFNRDYVGYREVNQNYLNYNRQLITDHHQRKEDEYQNKRMASMERVRDLDRYNQANMEAKQFRNEQQKLYRQILDNQVRVKDDGFNNFNMVHREQRVIPNPCKIMF